MLKLTFGIWIALHGCKIVDMAGPAHDALRFLWLFNPKTGWGSSLFLRQSCGGRRNTTKDVAMCVSAETSFGLAGLLLPVGTYCIAVATYRDVNAIPLAGIPLFFGIQQFAEGLVWVGMGRHNVELIHRAAMVYLFFALLFWLFWIPFSAVFLQPTKGRRRLLKIAAALGLAGGLALYLPLVWHPNILVVSVLQHSISYNITASPSVQVIPPFAWEISYVAIVSIPLFLITKKRTIMLIFCLALVASAAISHFYFLSAYVSIWCFFAAILSLVLAYVFYELPVATFDGSGHVQPS